jgi:hypothetical protein
MDVATLTPLVPTSKKDDEGVASTREVNAVPRAVIDAHLRDSFSDRPHVAGIAEREPPDPHQEVYPTGYALSTTSAVAV